MPTPALPNLKRSASTSLVPDLAAKRRCIAKDPIAAQPPSVFGNTTQQLDSSLFVTHRPPRADVIPLELVHSVFGEFVDDAQKVEVDSTCPQFMEVDSQVLER